jgi:MFS family permease
MSLLAQSNFGSKLEEWRIYNKITWRLIPFLLLLYIISFLDRVNIGFAKLQMAKDIGLSDVAYGLGAGIFFLGYSLCEIPSNLILQRVGAKFWIARILVVWGAISTSMMLIHTPTQFWVARLLLGVAEAGFYPGIILYLTYWYPVRLRSQICALFLLGMSISGLIGSPLSGGIMHTFNGVNGWHGWQWLFLFEGSPAIIFGLVAYFYLDDGPANAEWLTECEKSLVVGELESETNRKLKAGVGHKFVHVIKNSNVWLLAFVNFSLMASVYGLSFWSPQIIQDFGVKNLFSIGLITAIPYAAACTGMILIGKHSDRTGERKWHTIWCGVLGAFGAILSAGFAHLPVVSLVGLSLATTGALAGTVTLWALPGYIFSGAALAASFALMSTIGNVGGYLAPVTLAFVRQYTGRLEYGAYSLAATMISGSLVMMLFSETRASAPTCQQPVVSGNLVEGSLS